jgi:hypothetical protein
MGLRDRVMTWLDRGAAPPEGDPDAPVEIANELLIEGPRLVAVLATAGIEAHAIETTTDAFHGSARTRVRILVRRRDAQRGVEVLQAHRDAT